MAKMLHCGKNKIDGAVPVHGFGLGPTKAKAKSVAMDMAHGFANAVAATRALGLRCPTEECPKMRGPQVARFKAFVRAVEAQFSAAPVGIFLSESPLVSIP